MDENHHGNTNSNTNSTTNSTLPKRRGRKPKGGKVVSTSNIKSDAIFKKSAVIVHVKCTKHDIETETKEYLYNPLIEDVKPYSDILIDSKYEEVMFDSKPSADTETTNSECILGDKHDSLDSKNIVNSSEDQLKPKHFDYSHKIKAKFGSTITLHEDKLDLLTEKLTNINSLELKASCFWCTCEFDTNPCYIPKHFDSNNLFVYGNFCTPECALGYLLNELLDDTTKHERCHLLNYIYSDNVTNIKPALDPRYILSKFYGNLSIDEYRNLSTLKKKYSLIDKPMTLSNPEFNEDTQQLSYGN